MADQTLEDRVAKLEVEVARLKEALQRRSQVKPVPKVPWWEQNIGIFKDDPDYIEAMRLGREYRDAQQHEEGNSAT